MIRGSDMIRKLLGSLLFICALCAVLTRVSAIQQIKGIESGSYNPRSVYSGFYEMEKDSLDVLFLGSSHCYCSFSPREFYDRFEFTGYNLGSSQQSVWLSYYWLKEALGYQSPSVIVLETFFVTTNDGTGGDEPSVRKALDFMRPSPVKAEAVKTVSELHENVDPESFLLTNLRFHARTGDLKIQDFDTGLLENGTAMMGYCPLGYREHGEVFEPLKDSQSKADLQAAGGAAGSAEAIPLYPAAEEYLEKIVSLCEERGILLLFVKAPTTHWSVEEHDAVARFAGDHNIRFIDYNLPSEYAGLGYDFSQDSFDYGHPNVKGARKIAAALGPVIKEMQGERSGSNPQPGQAAPEKTSRANAGSDAQWESGREDYQRILSNALMTWIKNPTEYLQALSEEDHIILFASGSDSILSKKGELSDILRDRFGLPDLSGNPDYCFCEIYEKKHLQENAAPGSCTLEGTAGGGVLSIRLTAGDTVRSAFVNGKEISPGADGTVIVVYDRHSLEQIDRVRLYANGILYRGE